jgi:hypothetical protein
MQENRLERRAEEGESPVPEASSTPIWHPSNAGSEQAGVNLRGPPRKAKYS